MVCIDVQVMTDENGRSKGFGFVCFEKSEEVGLDTFIVFLPILVCSMCIQAVT